MVEFDESKFYEAYKRIRNKFRNYDSKLLIIGCLKYLHQPTQNKIDQLQKQPWLVLLLIKWVLLDDQSFAPRKRPPTSHDLNALLQSVHDLGSTIRLPTQFDHHRLFIRSISFQQFIYQREFSLSHLSRQIALFSKLPDTHLIKTGGFKFKVQQLMVAWCSTPTCRRIPQTVFCIPALCVAGG